MAEGVRIARYRPLSVRSLWLIHGALAAIAIATTIAGLRAPGLLAIPGAIVAGEVLVLVWSQRRAGAIVQGMSDAAAHVARGDYARAATLLDALADRARLIPNLHALIGVRRADVAFALGDLETADAIARAVLASGWIERARSALYVALPGLCTTLGAIAALANRTEEAERWRERGEAAISDARRGALVFLDAVLAARAHRFGDLAKLEVVSAHRPHGPTLAWIIAYATAETPAAHDKLGARLDAARPATTEALALAPHWPELAAFVTGSRERTYR